MLFTNRNEAGKLLASKLAKHQSPDSMVLAVPRGGIPIGCVIAHELGLPIDLARMTTRLIFPQTCPHYDQEREERILRYRYSMYMGDTSPANLKGRTVIITDDGTARSSTMLAIADAARRQEARKVIVAIPVTDPLIAIRLMFLVDEVICLTLPKQFCKAGNYYLDFSLLSDDEIMNMLKAVRIAKDCKRMPDDKSD